MLLYAALDLLVGEMPQEREVHFTFHPLPLPTYVRHVTTSQSLPHDCYRHRGF